MIGSLSALLVAAGLTAQVQGGKVLFVDDDAATAGDGASWNSPCKYLQDAIALALDPGNGISQIRIAQGTYRPDRSEANPDGTGDRLATFRLVNGVALMGGYVGLAARGRGDPDQRSIDLNLTILSGDLAGNDLPPNPDEPGDFPNTNENAYQVVTAFEVDSSSVLDGLIVSGGRADGLPDAVAANSRERGSAVNIHSAAPALVSCTFKSNWSFTRGAVNDQGSGASITNCRFIDNFGANSGGGLHIDSQSAATISGCDFIDNTALGHGGGAVCMGLPATTFTNCSFQDNSANRGGGIFNKSAITIAGCSFSANRGSQGGGVFNDQVNPTISYCTFDHNTAFSAGGAMWNEGGAPVLSQCVFTSNVGEGGGGGVWNDNSNASVLQCTFVGNIGFGPAGGLYNVGGTPVISSCTFTSNVAFAGAGGGVWNGSSLPTITNCTFSNNEAAAGGAMYNTEYSHATVTNCTFTANQSSEGGAMYCLQSDVVGTGCTFIDNVVSGGAFPVGGGLNNYYSNSTFRDCRFIHNSAELGGGGMYNEGAAPTIINCAFERNIASGGAGWGGGMLNLYFCTPKVVNCSFAANVANEGGGIFNFVFSNPQIVNCTLSGNAAMTGADGMHTAEGSIPLVRNCIIWNNGETEIGGIPIDIAHSCIKGGYAGAGNIDSDPMFALNPDPGTDGQWSTADDNLGDFHLMSGSPCIDAGDNDAVLAIMTPPMTDLDGQPRVVDDPATPDTGSPRGAVAFVDIGVDEYQNLSCPADIAPVGSEGEFGDGAVNVIDLLAVLSAWGSCVPPDGAVNCPADLAPSGGDGEINVLDLLAVIGAWGPCD